MCAASPNLCVLSCGVKWRLKKQVNLIKTRKVVKDVVNNNVNAAVVAGMDAANATKENVEPAGTRWTLNLPDQRRKTWG